MRVLLVGGGVRGKTWAELLTGTRGVELAGIVDRDPTRATVPSDDVPAAVRKTRSDAVIVATPPSTHYAIVKGALEQRKHVLCEKPLSDQLGEVVELIECADQSDVRLLVGMNFRYLSTSQKIREIVRRKELGELGYAQFSYVRHRDGNRDDLNDYPLTMAYPMLLEQSIHHFDLVRYCYDDEVASVVADSFRPSWSTYEGDCCVSALMHLESGARVNYVGTWTAAWNKMSFQWRSEFDSGVLLQRSQFEDLVRVEFDKELGLEGSRFKSSAEAEPLRAEECPPCTPFVDDSRTLLKELTGELEPVTTARDHLRSLLVVHACIESSREQTWVRLADLESKLLPSAESR